MSDLQVIGPQYGGLGDFKPLTAGLSGAQRVQDAHGRYLQAVLENRAFYLSAAAAAPTAYVGAGAGTPLLAIHNPLNSGKLLAALLVGNALRVQASVAGETGLALWAGPSAQPTGTKTTPTNALSQITSGSAALGFVNTALTGSTALALALPLMTYYWATAAAAFLASGLMDVAGIVVAAPGCQIALGLTTVPTSLTDDVALYWEEMPLQIQG
jgi:hypothetical protein